ncbi:M48 family metalloprotease [uncultured Duncaniella sp.]|uniref:M48 family metalloprotease n=2 Tax=uncultured Duncaniella sp. TaxID=2768039 RepID=UPI00258BC525|nr:M48 family metalloprotease [uncultured Duncaniella sp.]
MKFLLSIFTLLLFLTSYGKDNEKDFIKLIRKHDVPQIARNLPTSAEPKDFWNSVLDGNPILTNFVRDINKGKGAEKKAMRKVNQMKLFDYKLEVDILQELRGFCDTLAMDMGLPSGIFEMNIVFDPTPNAFAVVTEKGFAICLNSGLIEKLEFDYSRIMSVAAHEFVHGAFFHHLRTEYEVAKKERKDKVLGGIAAGLTAISAGVDGYTAGVTGQKYDPAVYGERIEQIAKDMKESSIKFRYKYNREEELEADLIALRFMQFLGEERKYQESLQIISSSRDYFWYDDATSDHPSTAYRLEFLDFALKNPQYGNEVKIKEDRIKKPRSNDKLADPLYE